MKRPRRFRVTLVRRLGLAGNPVRRRSDLIQAWARVVAGVLVLMGCAVAAMAGRAGYERQLAVDHVSAHHGYQVTGHVVSDADVATSPDGYPLLGTGEVAWRDRAGRRHLEVFVLRSNVRTVPLWVGADGRASTTAPTRGMAVVAGASTGIYTLLATVAGIAVAYLALVSVLARRRSAEWEREWTRVEPGWRRQTL